MLTSRGPYGGRDRVHDHDHDHGRDDRHSPHPGNHDRGHDRDGVLPREMDPLPCSNHRNVDLHFLHEIHAHRPEGRSLRVHAAHGIHELRQQPSRAHGGPYDPQDHGLDQTRHPQSDLYVLQTQIERRGTCLHHVLSDGGDDDHGDGPHGGGHHGGGPRGGGPHGGGPHGGGHRGGGHRGGGPHGGGPHGGCHRGGGPHGGGHRGGVRMEIHQTHQHRVLFDDEDGRRRGDDGVHGGDGDGDDGRDEALCLRLGNLQLWWLGLRRPAMNSVRSCGRKPMLVGLAASLVKLSWAERRGEFDVQVVWRRKRRYGVGKEAGFEDHGVGRIHESATIIHTASYDPWPGNARSDCENIEYRLPAFGIHAWTAGGFVVRCVVQAAILDRRLYICEAVVGVLGTKHSGIWTSCCLGVWDKSPYTIHSLNSTCMAKLLALERTPVPVL